MHIAYLVNRYPAVSHSFIRREIQALEHKDIEVLRVSVRDSGTIPDSDDQAEAERTVVLLGSLGDLFRDSLAYLLCHPISFFRMWVEALTLAWKGDRGLLAHAAYMMEACRLSRLMQAHGCSHVHAHFGTNPAAVALLAHRLSGVTFSFTVHGPEEFDRPVAIKLSRKIRLAEFVVAISSHGRSQLMRWCSRNDWDKIHVVRCGVNEAYFAGHVQEECGNSLFVCVGRLCEQKGQLMLVEAMARLRDRGVSLSLVLAGDGDMRTVIEDRIQELSLQDRIEITGWLSGDEVRHLLTKSKAMVLPSFAEGLPVVIMEAFAVRRPVISTYIAGIPELVENGVNGWVIPAGSVEHLVAALLAAHEASDDEISRLAQQGHDRVLKLHNVETEVSRLRDLYFAVQRSELEPDSERALEKARARQGESSMPSFDVGSRTTAKQCSKRRPDTRGLPQTDGRSEAECVEQSKV